MNKRLYRLMNWPEIESVIYSDGDHPDTLLGAHDSGSGSLIQAFFPEVNSVTVILETQDGSDVESVRGRIPMELADEDGFYACYIAGRRASLLRYHYEISNKDGSVSKVQDCYRFPSYYREEDEKAFAAGIHYSIYKRLGAHPMVYEGVEGTYFACFAPEASRISVVGDFNNWDGRIHQMSRFEDTPVFEIFIPNVKEGNCYQFEIRGRSGRTTLRQDPFSFCKKDQESGISIVTSLEGFPWRYDLKASGSLSDELKKKTLSVYKLDITTLGSFHAVSDTMPLYVKSLGFNAVCLRAFSGDSCSIYAPDSRFGSPEDLMQLVDAFHKEGLLVFFQWNPVSFVHTDNQIDNFDLSPVFEYKDELKRFTADGSASYFNLSDKRVSDYLIANAFFMISAYHADGFVTDDLGPMLYLDYGKQETAHSYNMYGGTENLDAVEFLKHLNSILHKKFSGVITIATETSAWSGVTGSTENDKLGFDYKIHTVYEDNMRQYIKTDPLFRVGQHDLLINDMLYQYTENYMLPLTISASGIDGATAIDLLPGEDRAQKLDELRLLLASIMVHPGAKILDLGETPEDVKCLDKALQQKSCKDSDGETEGIKAITKVLNDLYRSLPAFSENDDHPDGFEWIRQMANDQDVIVFLRKGSHPNEFVLVVANYSGAPWKLRVGVPYDGHYRKIFTGNAVLFGGKDADTDELVKAEPIESDGRAHSIEIEIKASSLSIYAYEV